MATVERGSGNGSRRRAALSYAQAGVDVQAADRAVERIRPLVRRTFGPRVIDDFGGFAGALRLDYDDRLFARNYREPVLISCTDGVGTKVLVAIAAQRYNTVGIDLVAMNVNDLLTSGGEPLVFLDYLAVHKVDEEQIAALIEGVAAGCEQAGCALLGGETAEMPDLYRAGDFDLAGFAVGVVERRRMISRSLVRPGDQLIGLASDGLHSNGYALARKALLERAGLPLDGFVHSLGEPLVEALLRPTRIYVRPVLDVLQRYSRTAVSGMAHITGGGIPGNLPRLLPKNCDAVVQRGSWPVPAVFGLIEHHGVEEEEMYGVFNMGVGFVLAVRPRSAAVVMRALEKAGERACVIGQVRRGRGRLEFR